MKGIYNEFKTFALRGSVIDLAVGLIIGASFNSVVNSLVSDLIMPPLGLIMGRVDFSELYVNLSSVQYESLSAAKVAGAPTINYGIFITSVVSFTVTALAVFLLVKFINKIRSEEDEKEPQVASTTKLCPFCLTAVPLRAVRCPNCTSHLKAGKEVEKLQDLA